MKRTAICIGVNRAATMTLLRGAIKGAQDFRAWATAQGCETTLLVDRGVSRVTVNDIFDAVQKRVDAGTYDQLIVYFSGHGILLAPGAEYWLLSRAPTNPNEAVNLSRSSEEARNCGIPHVVFVSDACRSYVNGPPLSGVTGGVIFPSRPVRGMRGGIDIFYATRPGDPAYEVPEREAAKGYRGIFTQSLLDAVKSPLQEWIERIDDGPRKVSVVTTQRLKPYLETTVPKSAAGIDVKLRQEPEVRAETALPKFFALVDPKSAQARREAPTTPPLPARETLEALTAEYLRDPAVSGPSNERLPEAVGLAIEVGRLAATRGRQAFETQTGFTLFGVNRVRACARRWRTVTFREGDRDALHMRLDPRQADADRFHSSIALEFDRTTGTVLPILPGYVGTVVVERGRVTSVNYVPSRNNVARYRQYERRARELEEMKAFAAVASRQGRFVVDELEASSLAGRIRQAKGIDPTMGLYAAYAYAQVGRLEDAHSVFEYMRDDDRLPIPFDVVMLATRLEPDAYRQRRPRFAPFTPMLSQGWALLDPEDPMHEPIHRRLRPHLIPSLWTTLDLDGVRKALAAVRSGRVR